MAGIYAHIPFCYSRCSYCDFYKTTNQQLKFGFINAICREIVSQKQFFNNNCIRTLYFGGGTPSVLSIDEWIVIFKSLHNAFDLSALEEVTVEVNPDDVTIEYINGLFELGVNRISMGIQSFEDTHLLKMNRRHNARQAENAIDVLKQSPINNISIDLIYGLPFMSMDEWKNNVQKAIDANVQHISAYHLTFEKGTPYYDLLKKGQLKEVSDELSCDQFNWLIQQLKKAGFENYEISNFAKPGLYSKHNSSYWTGDTYLGLGPSAHSFKGKVRQWNISDIGGYIEKLKAGDCYWSEEILSSVDIYNERIMLGLRTSRGVDVMFIEQIEDMLLRKFATSEFIRQISLNNIEISDGWYRVRNDKKLITDRIISDLFFTD